MARDAAWIVRAAGLAAEVVREAQVPDQGSRADHQNDDSGDERKPEEGLHEVFPSRCAGISPVGKYRTLSRSCSGRGMSIGIRA